MYFLQIYFPRWRGQGVVFAAISTIPYALCAMNRTTVPKGCPWHRIAKLPVPRPYLVPRISTTSTFLFFEGSKVNKVSLISRSG